MFSTVYVRIDNETEHALSMRREFHYGEKRRTDGGHVVVEVREVSGDGADE